ncbi:3'(2'),5'-bisphosphate nucleotidase CysQ [Yunchengibacter salinarum]|uniref:3'(2'),5'-bisphosphate nucleotidase CysQ n=1 Tax=Yunchengibacter salinarum TaxID=3133399 RepID=UPI0035B57E01
MRDHAPYPPTDQPPDPACPTLDADAQVLADAAQEAAELAMSYFRGGVTAWEKRAGDPVSDADMAVDSLLKERLTGARPGYGWLSEETEDAPDRLRCGRLWIVDPIDGTRAFLRGGTDWGVSLALVQDGVPVLAIMAAPARNALYSARLGRGATCNGTPIRVSGQDRLNEARMIGDPDAFRSRRLWPKPWPAAMTTHAINSMALRLCLVADGESDCCVTLRPKNDWDVAAADLILREAGGAITTGEGAPLTYNARKPLHAHIVAGTPALMPALMNRVDPALKHWTENQPKGLRRP